MLSRFVKLLDLEEATGEGDVHHHQSDIVHHHDDEFPESIGERDDDDTNIDKTSRVEEENGQEPNGVASSLPSISNNNGAVGFVDVPLDASPPVTTSPIASNGDIDHAPPPPTSIEQSPSPEPVAPRTYKVVSFDISKPDSPPRQELDVVSITSNNNVAQFNLPVSIINDMSAPHAWMSDKFDDILAQALLQQQGPSIEIPLATVEPRVIPVPPAPLPAPSPKDNDDVRTTQRINILESELALRRAESSILRAGVLLSSPLPQSRTPVSTTRRGGNATTPISLSKTSSIQTPSNNIVSSSPLSEDVLRHCASLVKRLGGTMDSTNSTLHLMRATGEKIATLSAKLAQAEARIAEYEAEKMAIKNMFVTYVERRNRKDALRVLASALDLNADERQRIGLDVVQSNNGRLTSRGFLDTLNDFVMDETS